MIKGCGKERKKKEGKKSQWGRKRGQRERGGREENSDSSLERSGIVFWRDPLPPQDQQSSFGVASAAVLLPFLPPRDTEDKERANPPEILWTQRVSSSWSEDVICPFFANPDLHRGHEKVTTEEKRYRNATVQGRLLMQEKEVRRG